MIWKTYTIILIAFLNGQTLYAQDDQLEQNLDQVENQLDADISQSEQAADEALDAPANTPQEAEDTTTDQADVAADDVPDGLTNSASFDKPVDDTFDPNESDIQKKRLERQRKALFVGVEETEEDEFEVPEWTLEKRVLYISESIVLFLELDQDMVADAETFIKFANKTNCRSSNYDLKVQCFLDTVEKQCEKEIAGEEEFLEECLQYYDILVINKLSESRFISSRERFKIIKKYGKEKNFMKNEFMKRYAALATSFSLSKHTSCFNRQDICFAESIDQFCLEKSDKGELTWQACVGSLVWFVSRP